MLTWLLLRAVAVLPRRRGWSVRRKPGETRPGLLGSCEGMEGPR